jgi:hypothetical protein
VTSKDIYIEYKITRETKSKINVISCSCVEKDLLYFYLFFYFCSNADMFFTFTFTCTNEFKNVCCLDVEKNLIKTIYLSFMK